MGREEWTPYTQPWAEVGSVSDAQWVDGAFTTSQGLLVRMPP